MEKKIKLDDSQNKKAAKRCMQCGISEKLDFEGLNEEDGDRIEEIIDLVRQCKRMI